MSLESGYTTTLTVYRPQGEANVVLEMETWEGGGVTTPDTKHRNPITRKSTARGGLRSREDVTLTRECDAEAWTVQEALEDSAGRDRALAVRQQIGPRGEAIGTAKSAEGLLKDVTYPNSDINSEDVGMLEVVILADE